MRYIAAWGQKILAMENGLTKETQQGLTCIRHPVNHPGPLRTVSSVTITSPTELAVGEQAVKHTRAGRSRSTMETVMKALPQDSADAVYEAEKLKKKKTKTHKQKQICVEHTQKENENREN